ncbi:MAG: M42 family metallopeptidase [Firmicutes bacterium]|nr:M42 family metallopeptidase [Bacillota bacterium]
MEYILEKAKQLLAIPSPSGYTAEVAAFVKAELETMGYEPKVTRKNGLVVCLNDDDLSDKESGEGAVLLAAHFDTLGAMVREIKSDGRLMLTRLGGLNANNVECENCTVHTRDGRKYSGTVQLIDASTHVNGKYDETLRTFDTVELVLDELVKNPEDVKQLGIMNGDYVSFEPRTIVTEKGFIKSRFLDDKLCSSVLLGLARFFKDKKDVLNRKVYLSFTSYEEVGHGGAADIPDDVSEMISVDMGCVGKGLTCDETMVSICAKDSGGPYDYQLTSRLIRLAKAHDLQFTVDVYPYYTSDVDVALKAGHNLRHSVIGPGVYASHGYERSHVLGVENTFALLKAHLTE